MVDPIEISPQAVYDDNSLRIALGISIAAIARARRSGELRFTKRGQRILYLGKWVLDWLTAEDAAKNGGVVYAT